MIDAKLLIQKYREGKCTEEELTLLHSWFHELNKDDTTLLNEDDITENIITLNNPSTKLPIKPMTWLKVAASLAAVFAIFFYIFYISNFYGKDDQLQELTSSSVILELEDGKKIDLKHAESGNIDNIQGITISKIANGTIQYRFKNIEKNSLTETVYHSITTPKGEIFEIVLSDDTRIMLNAQSSIRFPASFHNLTSREVELNGEAYFEVSKITINQGENKPFVVKSKNQKVEVLGTAFNIQAYSNEILSKTTLVHGKVRVNLDNTNHNILLANSGEQTIAHLDNLKKSKINIQQELAWKLGKIVFVDQDIYSIMRSIARYYPIEVEYLDDFKEAKFGGVISKGKALEDILKLVEETGEIKFEILPSTNSKSERRIKIMK